MATPLSRKVTISPVMALPPTESVTVAVKVTVVPNVEALSDELKVVLLPAALSGWTAGKVETTSLGNVGFGVTSASRTYTGPDGKTAQVQISGDSALLTQFATMLNNPHIAGVLGKVVMIGGQRAIQSRDGDVHIVINNKFLVSVTGSAAPEAKLAYAQAVDVAKLAKM